MDIMDEYINTDNMLALTCWDIPRVEHSLQDMECYVVRYEMEV